MWKPELRLAARRDGQRYDSDLTDEEWALVAPLIPPAKRGQPPIRYTTTQLDPLAAAVWPVASSSAVVAWRLGRVPVAARTAAPGCNTGGNGGQSGNCGIA
jgi:hypothetical protein